MWANAIICRLLRKTSLNSNQEWRAVALSLPLLRLLFPNERVTFKLNEKLHAQLLSSPLVDKRPQGVNPSKAVLKIFLFFSLLMNLVQR